MIRVAIDRIKWVVESSKRLEAIGLALMLVVGVLEINSLQEIDRHRAFFEQEVQGKILFDQVIYQSDMQHRSYLMAKSVNVRTIGDALRSKEGDEFNLLVDLTDKQFSMYDDVFSRSQDLLGTIKEFRSTAGFPFSQNLSRIDTDLKQLKASLLETRKELDLGAGIFKYPLTMLKEIEFLANKIREKIIIEAGRTSSEIEKKRSKRSRWHLFFFIVGSALLVVGKVKESIQ